MLFRSLRQRVVVGDAERLPLLLRPAIEREEKRRGERLQIGVNEKRRGAERSDADGLDAATGRSSRLTGDGEGARQPLAGIVLRPTPVEPRRELSASRCVDASLRVDHGGPHRAHADVDPERPRW